MGRRILVRFAFMAVGAAWMTLGQAEVVAMNPVQCNWFNCSEGGGSCCVIEESTYDCNEYCDHCYSIGHEGESCEVESHAGTVCNCNPAR